MMKEISKLKKETGQLDLYDGGLWRPGIGGTDETARRHAGPDG